MFHDRKVTKFTSGPTVRGLSVEISNADITLTRYRRGFWMLSMRLSPDGDHRRWTSERAKFTFSAPMCVIDAIESKMLGANPVDAWNYASKHTIPSGTTPHPEGMTWQDQWSVRTAPSPQHP